MAVSRAKGAKGKADRLARLIVRSRGYCQDCGIEGPPGHFDTAHIIGRRYNGTRCVEDNLWCLCRTCHYKVDNFHDEKARLVESTIGPGRYLQLVALAREGTGQKSSERFWMDEVERLKARCFELGLVNHQGRIPV